MRIKNNIALQNEKLKIIISHNKQYIENADNEYQVIRKLRHATKDTYRVIDDYLLNNEIEKARDYIRKIVKIADDKILFVNTDNKIVNSVINSKLTVAKSYGIKKMSLFGSYARGEAKKDSDLDIYCERGNIKTLIEQGQLEERLEKALGKDVDLVFIGSRMDDFFRKQLEGDKIRIC